jgi:hypothetical protein
VWGFNVEHKKERLVFLVHVHVCRFTGTPARVRPTDVSPICVFVHELADISVLHVHNEPVQSTRSFIDEVVEMRCKRPRAYHMVIRHMLSRFQKIADNTDVELHSTTH